MKSKVKKPIKKVVYEVKGGICTPSSPQYTLSIDPGFRYTGMTLWDRKTDKLSFFRYDNDIEVNLMKSKLPEFINSGVKVVRDYNDLIPKDIKRDEIELLVEYLHNGSNYFTEGLSSLITTMSHIFLRELGYNRILFVPTGSCSYLYGRQSCNDTFKRNELLTMLPDRFYSGNKKVVGKQLATPHISDSLFIMTYVYPDRFRELYSQEIREPLYEIRTL